MQSNSDSIAKKLVNLKSTTPKITITKTTYLSPISIATKPVHLQKQQQRQNTHPYTTLATKQITNQTTGGCNLTTVSVSDKGPGTTATFNKVAIKDLKEIIRKPLIKANITPTTASSLLSGGVTNYNMAIVAATRPQLTIVASKTPIGNKSMAASLAETSSTATASSSTAVKSSTTATAETSTESSKMEHSYIRDTTPKSAAPEITNGLQPARTVLVRRPPQCPSCHTNPLEEKDVNDANQAPIPSYNEIAAKEAMLECSRIAKYVKNNNYDDQDWEAQINQIGWSNMQKNLFSKVVRILDNDQLGRLANLGRPNEAMQRRVVVDKSAARMRKALASVAWDSRLTQWLHCLLMDCLPPSYMASYLDILQTLNSKLPTLMDKMLFGRPLNVSQELLAPVMKKKWEPQIATKNRKLAHDTVIVALPSMPTSGRVPNRLQKWYQHLATITQIVQVTLPMTSGHISRQPLEQVAEQIVSLTRVKIQELRNENSQRSIILIGFNAGAALALQVAMSESVACVVCMGFAYNTYNGVRGTPDDKILDIKIPILFVIGQNSARSSPEEIEFLRENMQSETSLVVVGSADDVLRVPKSRRKIESVTQSMVDTMVVDEVYDFINKILTNPPGPRSATAMSSAIYAKQSKTAAVEKSIAPARKRKQEGMDSDGTPAKSKYIKKYYKKKDKQETKAIKKPPKVQDPFQVKRKVGRPRTRPLPNAGASNTSAKFAQMHTSTPVALGKIQPKPKNALTNDDLNQAIQSIMTDANDTDSSVNTSSGSNSQKPVTNFELVAQSGKSMPIKTTHINAAPKQVKIASSPSSMGTKIKMIPSNQFVQLKPTTLQSQSKIYTIKTSPMAGQTPSDTHQGPKIGSIVTTTPTATSSGQHIFTLKTPNGQTTQFATALGGQPKYTVIKNAAGNTTLQLSATAKTLHPVASTSSGTSSSNYDISNIIDMPILFADNDGNISDAVSSPQPVVDAKQSSTFKQATASGVGQLIISQKIIKEASSPITTTTSNLSTGSNSYVFNKSRGAIIPTQQLSVNKPNKVVFINRSTMKPYPSKVAQSNLAQQMPKYTKVVVTGARSPAGASIVPRAMGSNRPVDISGLSAKAATVKPFSIQALSSASSSNSPTSTPSRTGGILNVQTKNLPQIQIINKNPAALKSIDKPQIRNIVVKPGGLKQIPPHLTSQLLNRNLTVRKLLVNLLPSTKAASAASGGGSITSTSSPIPLSNTSSSSTTPDGTDPASSPSSSVNFIQTSPKIITLNPLSRTSTPTTKSD